MAVTSAMASGLGLRPRSRKLIGSPGTSQREKNTITEETNTVKRNAPILPAASFSAATAWRGGLVAPGAGGVAVARLLCANLGRPWVVQVVHRR